MDRTRDLGSSSGSVVPLLVRYAFPSIIGKVVSALYNMVYHVFIGRRRERGRPPLSPLLHPRHPSRDDLP